MPVKFKRPRPDGKIDYKDFVRMQEMVEAMANMRVMGGKFQISGGNATLDVSSPLFSYVRPAKLTSALAVAGAGAPETDATTANFKFLEYDSSGGDTEPLDLVTVDPELTLVNRSQDLSGVSGDYCFVVKARLKNGFEYAILAKDC